MQLYIHWTYYILQNKCILDKDCGANIRTSGLYKEKKEKEI